MRFMVVVSCVAVCGAAISLARCSSTPVCDPCAADAQPLPLSVDVVPLEVWTQSGGTATVAVSLGRGAGGDGDVAISLTSDAGAGVTADPLTIAGADTKGTLTVHIEPSFTQGSTTMTIEAASSSALATTPLVVHVVGATGTLDSTFGNAGVTTLPGSSPVTMILQQSGIIVGLFNQVVRLTADGASDGAFAATSLPGELRALALAPDGRIFAVLRGTPTTNFGAVRINAGGGLDPTYDVESAPIGGDTALAGAVQPGGALVVGGYDDAGTAFELARYAESADGAVLDPTFGEGGVVVTSFSSVFAAATSVIVAANGSLYALGEPGTLARAAAVHYTPNGSIDSTFVDGGVLLLDAATPIAAAFVDPSGAIVASTFDASIFRILPDGTVTGTASESSLQGVRAMTRDPASGDIYLGGWYSGCFIARFSSAGVRDATFSVVIPQADCELHALAIDGQRRVVALGSTTAGIYVERYWP